MQRLADLLRLKNKPLHLKKKPRRLKKKPLAISLLATLLVSSCLALTGCDKINRMNRSLDTMLGGDFDVYIVGQPEPFRVNNGKITSVPEKGYYVFYPTINGKERLVQSPIASTTIIQTN